MSAPPIADTTFLVLKKGAADQLRLAAGRPDLTMGQCRAVLLAMLRTGQFTREYRNRLGLHRLFDCNCQFSGGPCRVKVCLSGDPAPDGKKTMGFIEDVSFPDQSNCSSRAI